MGTSTYCPACFAEIARGTTRCPECRTEVASWNELGDYPWRLIHALHHPSADSRLSAILTLARQKEARACGPLADCTLRMPQDIAQGTAIMRALAAMPDSPLRLAALRRLAVHPAASVRAEAGRLLGDHRPITRTARPVTSSLRTSSL